MNKKNTLLGHKFDNLELFELAITHKSFSTKNNERLEFIGDALLNFFVADILYREFPEHDEGTLTQLRSMLVNRESLNLMGKKLGIDIFLKLGNNETTKNNSILGNTLEAILGAIYLDGGFRACYKSVKALYTLRIKDIKPNQEIKDPKTLLQEYLQKTGYELPQYILLDEKPNSTSTKRFKVKCFITHLNFTSIGWGKNKKIAERRAAEAALLEILDNE